MNKTQKYFFMLNILLISFQYLIFKNDFGNSFLYYGAIICSICIFLLDLIFILKIAINLYHNSKYYQVFGKHRHYTRTVSLLFGSIMSFGQILYQFYLTFNNESVWFMTLSVYHLILLISHLYIAYHLFYDYKHAAGNYKVYKHITYLIILIIPAFIGLIVLTLNNQATIITFKQQVIILAVFTFYSMIVAINGLFKSYKSRNIVLQADSFLSIVSSFLSMFTLQTVMIKTFGNDENYFRLMTKLSGSIAVSIIILICIYMIVVNYRHRYTS